VGEDAEQLIRLPKQARARQRVEAILNAARELILQKGCAGLKMSEIAKEAGVTMGSMYQYFPNKTAIIQALSKAYLDESRCDIEKALTPPPNNLDELSQITTELLEDFYRRHRDNPVLKDIWDWSENDKAAQHIDTDDTRQVTDIIMGSCGHLIDQSRIEEAWQTLHLIMNHGVASVTVALQHSSPAKSRQIMEIATALLNATFEVGIKPLAAIRS
jgi:AcrR family transcriptional regulator